MTAFHEARLPARLAFGCTGGVERRTQVTTLGSGFERRSSPFSSRPWSPAHLKVRAQGGDAVITWIRRARLAGDGWDAEVPLGEEREVYRVEILDGETVVRAAETSVPTWICTAAQRAADFPAGPTGVLAVRIAQGSALFGWGASRRALL